MVNLDFEGWKLGKPELLRVEPSCDWNLGVGPWGT